MILPDNYDFTGKDIKSRDFVDEFSLDPSIVTGKFGPVGNEDYLYKEGDKPAELGTFKFDVEKPKNLDPFTSYSIYMVLKDRSGQLSIIESKSLISDSKPPLVSNIRVESIKDNDTAVKVKLNVDEKAKFYAIPVKKYILDAAGNRVLNADYFNTDGTLKDIDGTLGSDLSDAERKASFMSINGTLKEASSDKFGEIDFDISELDAHEEYGIYIAAEDTYGNFTVRQRSNSTSTDINEPIGGMMKATFYTDGTKPFIDNDQIVYRNLDATNPTFTITYNEAIMREKDTNHSIVDATNWSTILDIADEDGNLITGNYSFVSYTVGTKTTDKSTLVIKPNSTTVANQTFTVTMKAPQENPGQPDKLIAYDYIDQNGFVLDKIGKYEWPGDVKSKIEDAVLTGINAGTPAVPASTTMRAMMYLDIDLSLNQTYYYAVTNSSKTSVDPQLVMDLVNNPDTPNNDIFAYGSGQLSANSVADKQATLNLTAPPAVGAYTPVFTKGNNFFIFTIDKYGNIVWANDESSGLKYRQISNDFNIPFQ